MVGIKGSVRALALAAVAVALMAAVVSVAGAGAAVKPLTAGGFKPERPAVSGNRVVWADQRSGRWDLWAFDGTAKTTEKITSGTGDKVQPAISGDLVAYVAFDTSTGGDIWLYDFASKTSRPLFTGGGDQLNPAISGNWVVWEDYSNSYSARLWALDIGTTGASPRLIDSGYGYHKRSPRIAGTTVVYESVNSAGSGDIYSYDLSTLTRSVVSAAAADERLPVTDGRWVAWMAKGDGTDLDVYAKDLQSGQVVSVATAAGEQSLPVIGDGVVYYADVSAAGVSWKTMALDTGARGFFPYRGKAAIAGVAASGDSLAWLQQAPERWQVKAVFGAPVPGAVSASSLLPSGPAWNAFRFTLLPAHADIEGPVAMYASVDPGETNVPVDEPLRVFFSEDMDPSSLTAGTVRVTSAATGEQVPASVTYAPISRSAIITPMQPLGDAAFLLEVDPAVTDAAGNAANAPMTVAFSTGMQLTGTQPPNRVEGPTTQIVDANASVKMTWNAGSDPDGTVSGYYVKRSAVAAVTGAEFAAATTLTPVGAGSALIPAGSTVATFAAAADEKAKSSTYYYLVVAVDNDGMVSQAWLNVPVAPHGTYVVGGNTATCNKCHNTHGGAPAGFGSLGARGAKACYKCHGGTAHATAFGFNSVNNIQRDFWDYTSNPMPSTGSRHGNAFIRASDDNQQCDMCHAPHKKPYDAVAANSYGKLLKRPANDTTTTATVYSTDAAAFGKVLCVSCHAVSGGGGAYAYMTAMGGASAYDNSAGNHQDAQWNAGGTLAHGLTYMQNDVARAQVGNGGSEPQNLCQVCHDKHGSQSDSLLSYRRAAFSSTTNLADQGGLCFKCHTASPAAPDNTTTANAWNSRNVQAQFAKTGSTHPIKALSAPPVQGPGSWSQDDDTELGLNALASTEVSGSGTAAVVRLLYTAAQTGVVDTRVPTSDSQAGGWTTAPLWSKIDDAPPLGSGADGDFITGTSTTEARFGFSAFAVPANATNIVVRAYMRIQDTGGNNVNVNTFLRIGGTNYVGTSRNPGTTWTNYTDTWNTNPRTGAAWLPADVNGTGTNPLQLVGIDQSAATNQRCSQLYLEVTYDLPASFATSGTAVSPVIAAPGTLNSWTDFSAAGSVPANTTLTFDVLNPQAGDAVIPGYTGITLGQMPYALNGLSTVTYPTLKVRANFTGNGSVTSSLDSWVVNYQYTPGASVSTLTCYNCHNTHFVSKGGAAAWDMSRVSDPTDTNNTHSLTSTQFCQRCHGNASFPAAGDGSITINKTVNATTFIPYTVAMSPTSSWPYFNGWYKADFVNAGHNTATAANGKALCENCHDPHASDNKSLTAWTRPAGVTWTGTAPAAGVRDNSAAGANEENLCYKCHGDGAGGRGKAAGAPNIYTPSATTYAHPISSVTAQHSTKEDASALIGASRHAECGDCHDPHSARPGAHTQGSSAGAPAIRGASGAVPTYGTAVMSAPTGWSVQRNAGGATDYEAYLCLKCHSSYLPGWSASAPNSPSGGFQQTDIAAEFNPNNASGHNVMGDAFTKAWTVSGSTWAKAATFSFAAGWNADSSMTCSDCHAYSAAGAAGPHGSANKFMLKWGGTTDWYTNTVAGLGGYGQAWNDNTSTFFCGGCHTADTHSSWMNRSDHTSRQCSHCHIAIPHGWSRPRMIVYTSDAAPYKVTTNGNLTGILRNSYNDSWNGQKSDCKDSCAGDHSGTGTYW